MSTHFPVHEVLALKQEEGHFIPVEVTTAVLQQLEVTVADAYEQFAHLASLGGQSLTLVVSFKDDFDKGKAVSFKLNRKDEGNFISVVDLNEPDNLPLHMQNAELSVSADSSLEQFYQMLAVLARKHKASWVLLTVLAEGEQAQALAA